MGSSSLINLSEIVQDQDFAQSASLVRTTGAWGLDFENLQTGLVPTPTTVQWFGIIQPARAEDIDMVPEAQRKEGAMCFHSVQPIYATSNDNANPNGLMLADVFTWRGQDYEVMHVWPWEDFGYYRAVAVRKAGD